MTLNSFKKNYPDIYGDFKRKYFDNKEQTAEVRLTSYLDSFGYVLFCNPSCPTLYDSDGSIIALSKTTNMSESKCKSFLIEKALDHLKYTKFK